MLAINREIYKSLSLIFDRPTGGQLYEMLLGTIFIFVQDVARKLLNS
jgi:hypothetical protein